MANESLSLSAHKKCGKKQRRKRNELLYKAKAEPEDKGGASPGSSALYGSVVGAFVALFFTGALLSRPSWPCLQLFYQNFFCIILNSRSVSC